MLRSDIEGLVGFLKSEIVRHRSEGAKAAEKGSGFQFIEGLHIGFEDGFEFVVERLQCYLSQEDKK